MLASEQRRNNEEITRECSGLGSSEHCARKLGSTGDDKCDFAASLYTQRGLSSQRGNEWPLGMCMLDRTCMQSITMWKY